MSVQLYLCTPVMMFFTLCVNKNGYSFSISGRSQNFLTSIFILNFLIILHYLGTLNWLYILIFSINTNESAEYSLRTSIF